MITMSNKNGLTIAEQLHEESQNISTDYRSMVSRELQEMMAMQEQQQAFFERLDNRRITPKATPQVQPQFPLQQVNTAPAALKKL
jgi:uncharacterized membrane protein